LLPIGDILTARTTWRPGGAGPYSAGFVDDGDGIQFGPGVYALVALPGRCFHDQTPMTIAGTNDGFRPCDNREPVRCITTARRGRKAAAPDPDCADDATRPASSRLAKQWIVYTDLGLQLMRGPGGLHVAVRSLSSGTAQAGAHVQLVSTANRVLAEADSEADGMVRFDPNLAHGVLGNSLRGIFAIAKSGDFAFLDAASDALDLTDRNIAGRAAPGPIDGYVWTERGIYRPGETIEAMVMLRNGLAGALDAPPPLRARLIQPDDRPLLPDKAVTGFTAGASRFQLSVPQAAAAGEWKLEVVGASDAVVASTPIQIKAFVPNRIELKIDGVDRLVLEPGKVQPVTLHANYLYGAPAAGLGGLYRISFRRARQPFAGLEAFQFGLESGPGQDPPPTPIRPLLPTDAEGATSVPVMIDAVPKGKYPLEGVLRIQVNDTDGGNVGKEYDHLVMSNPDQHWLGARVVPPATVGDNTRIELVAVSGDGRRVAQPRVQWQLYAEDEAFQWERLKASDPFNFQMKTNLRFVGSDFLDIGAGAPAAIEISQPLGRYQIVVSDSEGTATRLSFTNGFEGGRHSAGRPELVRVTLDKSDYKPGETMTVNIAAAISGELMLAVASDQVWRVVNKPIGPQGLKLTLPAEPGWGPHPYLLATVFRAGTATDTRGAAIGPARAIGAVGFAVHQPNATLDVAIAAPPRAEPKQPLRVTLHVAGLPRGRKGYVVLAAVDAGILSLTDFTYPDPASYFLGPRRLAIEMLDNYGRLITGEGAAAAIRSGGDALGPLRGLGYEWENVVTWMSPIVPLDEGGNAELIVPVPQFLGRLELMAVAWTEDQVGAAHAPVAIHDVVIARPDWPRFLAPDDKGTLGLELRDGGAGAGDYEATIEIKGPVKASGEPTHRFHLDAGGRTRVELGLVAEQLASVAAWERADIDLHLRGITNRLVDLTGHWSVPVRSGVLPTTKVARGSIGPRQSLALNRDDVLRLAAELVPDSIRIERRISGAPELAPGLFADEVTGAAMSTGLLAGRAALLLAAVAEAAAAGRDAPALLDIFEKTEAELLSLQRADGAFRAYPGELDNAPVRGEGAPEPLSRTAYIGDILLTAREQGLTVPAHSLLAAGNYLLSAYRRVCAGPDTYAVFVLVRLGRVQYDAIDELRTACARWSDSDQQDMTGPVFGAAALSAFGLDVNGAEALRVSAAFEKASNRPLIDIVDRLYGLAEAHLPAATVERIFAAAIGKVVNPGPAIGLEARGKLALASLHAMPLIAPQIEARIDGTVQSIKRGAWRSPEIKLSEVTAPLRVENLGARPLTHELVVRGVPRNAPSPAPDDPIVLQRKVYRLKDGLDPDQPIDPSATAVDRNELLVVVIEGKLRGGDAKHGVLTELLPAGWVIESPDLRPDLAIAPEAPASLRLDPDNKVVLRREALDDRFVALLDLGRASEGFRLGFLVRAAYAGEFLWPGTTIAGQDDAAVAGHTEAVRVAVKPGG
jgi:uncharacterized protein YfaS (alpha-2-macroglobulin family)